jgi:hypothetical protein
MQTSQITTSSVASSTSLSTLAAITRSTPTSSAPENTGTSAPVNDGGLSTGEKAGLGVGSVLGVALIAALCWLAWVMRKKSISRPQHDTYDEAELVTHVPAHYDHKGSNSDAPTYVPTPGHYVYADMRNAHEAEATPVPDRHELPVN